MITTKNPKFGHFIVTKMQEVDNFLCFQTYGKNNPRTYGVFRIDHRSAMYFDSDEPNIKLAHKVHLTPVGKSNYLERDWYVCDIFSDFNSYQTFNDYTEALEWANSMNGIKRCN